MRIMCRVIAYHNHLIVKSMDFSSIYTQFVESINKLISERDALEQELTRCHDRFNQSRSSKANLQRFEDAEVRASTAEAQVNELRAELDALRTRISNLEFQLSDDRKNKRIEEFETWLRAIAEKVSVKSSTNVNALMGSVSDAIRKLVSR